MATMEFIQEKVNEGQLLTALSLEQKVLANGVLPSSGLLERASLVQGILLGLFEKGRIDEALRLVYNPGAVRSLWDGDKETLRQNVLNAVRKNVEKRGDNTFYEPTIKLLDKEGEQDLLRTIILENSLKKESEDQILDTISNSLAADQQQTLYTSLAERALAGQQYQRAASFFKEANDQTGMDKLYQTMMKNDVHDYALLLSVAAFDSLKKQERITVILQRGLREVQSKRTAGLDLDYQDSQAIRVLYHAWKSSDIPLQIERSQLLKELYVEHASSFDPDESPEMLLLWARQKAQQNPKTAYQIFVKQNYDGPELLTAILAGLELNTPHQRGNNAREQMEVSDIPKPHLEVLLPQVQLELRAQIAGYLGKKDVLLTLSEEFRQKNDIRNAYRCFIVGGGDQQSPTATEMRQQLLELELKKEHGPSFFFLEREDIEGHQEIAAKVMEKYPHEAYDLARRVKAEDLIQQAREKLVAKDPLKALGHFDSKFSSEPVDHQGVELVVDALAVQYQLPREKVLQYVTTGKQ